MYKVCNVAICQVVHFTVGVIMGMTTLADRPTCQNLQTPCLLIELSGLISYQYKIYKNYTFTGKFKLRTRTEGRRLVCYYNPKKAGEYQIRVTWDGDHIHGSPFTVYKADRMRELAEYQSRRQHEAFSSAA